MRKLIGPHLGGSWISNLDILRQWQPPLALVLSPEVDKVSQLREACPNTIIVGRFYHEDAYYSRNIWERPVDFAREIHNEIVGSPVTPLLDYVQSNNETNQDWEGIQKLNIYSQEWMFLADQSQMYKCAIMAFSVGNPDLPDKPNDPAGFSGRMLYWQQVLPSLNYAQHNDHILLMHAYGFPDMFHPDAAWYIYRFERQVAANLRTLGITRLKYGYGEQGIDRYIVGEKGGYKSVPTTDENYVNQQLQWERDLQGEDLLLGGAIFTAGDSGGWGSYDIFSTHVASMIADHYANHAGDYNPADKDDTIFIPDVGTGGQPMPAPTFKREIEQDAEDYGVKVAPFSTAGLKNGDLVWIAEKVERLHEAEGGGRHHFYFETVDENGQRLTGVPIRVWWPTGDDTVRSEAKPGEPYSANKPFTPGKNAFSAAVVEGEAGDIVTGAGMGQQFPEGFNTNIHASIVVRWVRRTYRASVTTPAPAPPVTQPPPQPAPIPPTPVPTTPSGSNLVMPCKGVVTQRWGENPDDYKRFGIPGHNGLDIANKAGAPILAIADGTVAFVGTDTDYGNYARIYHAQFGFFSFYAHLQSYHVGVGQRVERSQLIGVMGSTGNSTGNHLHLEIRLCDQQGNYINLSGGYGKGRIDPEIAYHMLNKLSVSSTNLVEIVAAAAREFGVDARLFDALARAESDYDPHVVSSAGAVGLVQIMPDTFAEWAPKVGATNIRDPRDNARVGAAYLNFLAKYYRGDLRKALYAYNWGPGNVDSGGTPPPETIAYANRILGTQPL